MCQDSVEDQTIWFSHEKQGRTYLQGATSEFEANTNGPASLREWQYPGARLDPNTSRICPEEADKITQDMVMVVGTDLSDVVVHLDQAAISPDKSRVEQR